MTELTNNDKIEQTIAYLKAYRSLDESLFKLAQMRPDSRSYIATKLALEYWDTAIEALEMLKERPCVSECNYNLVENTIYLYEGEHYEKADQSDNSYECRQDNN